MLKIQKNGQTVNLKGDKGSARFSTVQKPSREEIANKAYELYEKRGCRNAQDWDDWFTAEEWCRENKTK